MGKMEKIARWFDSSFSQTRWRGEGDGMCKDKVFRCALETSSGEKMVSRADKLIGGDVPTRGYEREECSECPDSFTVDSYVTLGRKKEDVPKSHRSTYDETVPIVHPDRFFYDLADYSDKKVYPSDIRKKYLDRYRGLMVVFLWQSSCISCVMEFSTYNEMFRNYRGQANFVGVLLRHDLERADGPRKLAEQSKKEIEEHSTRFKQGGFAVFGGQDSYFELMESLRNKQARNELETNELYWDFGRERKEFGLCIDGMRQDDRVLKFGNVVLDGDRVLEFGNVVLDHMETYRFLTADRNVVPQAVILRDGEVVERFIGGGTPSTSERVRSFLNRMLK